MASSSPPSVDLTYGVVARESVVLAHGWAKSLTTRTQRDNTPFVASRLVAKATQDHKEGRFSYSMEGKQYHVLLWTQQGHTYAFACVADADVSRRPCFEMLARLQLAFAKDYVLFAAQAQAHELDASLGALIETELQQCRDKLAELKQEMDELIGIVTLNREKVIARGENIDDTLRKTMELNKNSFSFKRNSRRLQAKHWWSSTAFRVFLMLLLLAILYLILFFSCGRRADLPECV